METKLLGVTDCDAVSAFLQDHYGRSVAATEMYIDLSTGYVRWLLSVATVWGLCLEHNLVGVIALHRYRSQMGDQIGYVGIWCVNEIGRSHGLGKQLLDYALDHSPKEMQVAIPYLSQIPTPHSIRLITLTIRTDVLSAMGIIEQEPTSILIGDDLGLRITRETDLPQIVTALNNHPCNTSWTPKWTLEMATQYLLPAPHAIYSYVRRDNASRITDFIQGTAIRITYPDLGHTLFAVMIGSWYVETVPLDQLILSWAPHLAISGVHQIVFPDTLHYKEIALPQQCLVQEMGVCVPSGHPIPYPDVCVLPWI